MATKLKIKATVTTAHVHIHGLMFHLCVSFEVIMTKCVQGCHTSWKTWNLIFGFSSQGISGSNHGTF